MRQFSAVTLAALALALVGCGEEKAPAADRPAVAPEPAAEAPAPAPAKPADEAPAPVQPVPSSAAPEPAAAGHVADVVQILLDGAKKGAVPFPHKLHTGLPIVGGKCDTCHHTSDAKGTGAQKCAAAGCHDGKTAGAPDGKDAFHDKCRGCHTKALAAQPDNEKLKAVKSCKGCHAG